MANYDNIFSELAELLRLSEQLNKEIDAKKNEIRDAMTAAGLAIVNGSEHKATLKEITTARLDSAALKRELPEIAARYTVTSTTTRFNFA